MCLESGYLDTGIILGVIALHGNRNKIVLLLLGDKKCREEISLNELFINIHEDDFQSLAFLCFSSYIYFFLRKNCSHSHI